MAVKQIHLVKKYVYV